MLAGVGYFFSGAITNIIGDLKQVGIWLFFIVLFGVIIFYVVERYYLSEKVEEANPNPETIHKIEEKLHNIEERLHLTTSPDRVEVREKRKKEEEKKTDAETRKRADAEKEERKSVGG